MRDSNSSGKKPIEEVQTQRPRKPKLERLGPEAAERKRAEEKEKKHFEQIQFLSRTAMELVEFPFKENIYQFIGEKLKELVGDCFVVINSYDKASDRLCTRAVSGLGKHTKRIIEILGREPVGKCYPINDENGRRELLTGRLVKGPEGLYELTFGEIPKGVCRAIEELLGLRDIYAIGLTSKGELLGTAIVITRGAGCVRNQNIIETFVYQAAVALQRRLVGEALQRSKKEWETTFDAMSDWVALINPEGRILLSNCVGEEFTGVSSAQMLGQSICKLVHGTEKCIPACPLSKMLETVERAAMEFQVPDTSRWLMVTVDPVINKQGNIVGAAHITRDITERKNAEELLRNAEKKWRNSFDSLEDVVLIIDTDYNIENINEAGLKLLAKSKEEIIGKKCYQVVGDADGPPEKCPCGKSLKTKKVESVDRYEKKFGKYFSIKSSPIFDENGEIIKFVDLRRDITERKKAEESLQRQRDEAQKYLDIAGVMFVAINAGGEVTLINKKGCEVLGYEEEEIVGKNWFDNFLPKRVADWLKTVSQNLLAGRLKVAEYFENPVLTKSGEERLIAWHNTVLRSEQGDIIGTLSSGEDITERKRAEGKLLDYQAQLKSLASQLTLAEEHERRRIATELHDRISQSLVVSKLKLEALHEAAASEDFGKELSKVCNSLGQTIAETRSLTSEVHSPLLSLLGFEAAVAEWLAEQIGEKHGIATEFEDDGQPKPMDDDIRVLLFRDVREMLTNVVRHANANKVKVSIHKVGSELQVSVEDDGVGFDPVKVAMVAVKEGAFGLFSIHERLELSGSHLKIESKPGHGTRITITATLKGEKIAKGRKI